MVNAPEHWQYRVLSRKTAYRAKAVRQPPTRAVMSYVYASTRCLRFGAVAGALLGCGGNALVVAQEDTATVVVDADADEQGVEPSALIVTAPAGCAPVDVCRVPDAVSTQLPASLAALVRTDPVGFLAASEAYFASRQAELLPPDPEAGDAWRRARLEMHDAYVFDDTPVLAVGQAGYVTAQPWTLAVASTALQLGDTDAARVWLVRAGAPWDTNEELDRCWLSLRSAPASVSEWSAIEPSDALVAWVDGCAIEAPTTWRSAW